MGILRIEFVSSHNKEIMTGVQRYMDELIWKLKPYK